MHGILRLSLLASTLAILSCGVITGSQPVVSTRLEVNRTAAEPGDTVELRAIATNHGRRTLEIGYGCGPGVDFEARLPSGEVRHLLRELFWICKVLDSNVLEPGETDTLTYRWSVPDEKGTYRLVAGIRTAAGIDARSGDPRCSRDTIAGSGPDGC